MKYLTFLLYWTLMNCSKCDPLENQPKSTCHYNKLRKLLVCRHFLEKPEEAGDIFEVELVLFPERLLNVSKILEDFPDVQKLSVLGGLSPWIEADGIQNSKLKTLVLNHLHLKYIPREIWNSKLEVLDLTGNQLQQLDIIESPSANLEKIYLSANKWNCSLSLDWVFQLRETTLEDAENITCHGEPYAGKPLVPIAKLLKNLKNQCPPICNCTMANIVANINTNDLETIIRVDCSGRELTELPKDLPNNTNILLLANNFIRDLSPLLHNPSYKTVSDLYLDNNRVNSIEGLEGSYWLSRFRVLSLCGNDLSQLPTYALDNSLQRNPNMPNAVRVFLGSNPWRCDCIFTPGFQELLQKYKSQIADVDDVRCSDLEGDEISLLPILTLSRSSVCRPDTEYSARALDLLNGVLASLIILILGKLAYDYYHFKRTGKLPWIVMKMP